MGVVFRKSHPAKCGSVKGRASPLPPLQAFAQLRRTWKGEGVLGCWVAKLLRAKEGPRVCVRAVL